MTVGVQMSWIVEWPRFCMMSRVGHLDLMIETGRRRRPGSAVSYDASRIHLASAQEAEGTDSLDAGRLNSPGAEGGRSGAPSAASVDRPGRVCTVTRHEKTRPQRDRVVSDQYSKEGTFATTAVV
jgi:hypothetical protein